MKDEQFSKALTEVAEEITNLILRSLADDQGTRVEDAITAAAALAGSYLLQDSSIDLSKLSPGSSVSADEVNDLGHRLLTLMQHYATAFELDGENGWDVRIPEENKPGGVYPFIEKFLGQATTSFKSHGIPDDIRAGLMGLTAIRFIAEARQILPEDIGKSIALEAMIMGSRTVPPRQ